MSDTAQGSAPATSWEDPDSEATDRRITDEGVAKLRSRLGAYYKCGPYRTEITEDDLRNFTVSHGDWNPLFFDPEYGRTTRFGTQIAHPCFTDVVKHHTAAAIGALPGIHTFHAGNDLEFFRPVRVGDVIGPTFRPWRSVDKQGTFAGRMVTQDMEIVFRNQHDELVGVAHGNVFRVVREQARKRGKYEKQQKEPYSQEQLEQIWDLVDNEEVRGDRPRYWEHVQVGDEVGPIVRGPLRTVEISFRNWFGAGNLTGAGGMTYGGHYYQFEEYLRRPGYAEVEETTGVMDHPHRGHWEDSFARKIGVPGIYDVAVQRTAWLSTLATNWCGDDGWLRRIWCEFRKFNVEGDTTWITGKVVRKWIEGRQHLVEIEIESLNQRGESSTPGGAWVVLPSVHPGSYVPGV